LAQANTDLVTGGAGFIGSHLVDRLIADGRRVHVLDNLAIGRRANLAQHDGKANLTFFEGDVDDKSVAAGGATSGVDQRLLANLPAFASAARPRSVNKE